MVEAAAGVDRVPRPLRSAASIALNSPANSQMQQWTGNNRGDEVVPDSEEERLRYVDHIHYHAPCSLTYMASAPRKIEGVDSIAKFTVQPQVEVIEIFSSDEDMYVLGIMLSCRKLISKM